LSNWAKRVLLYLLLFSDTWYCQIKASDNMLCQAADLGRA
jgi:hypothetical protein